MAETEASVCHTSESSAQMTNMTGLRCEQIYPYRMINSVIRFLCPDLTE